jgi:hypothetical protein
VASAEAERDCRLRRYSGLEICFVNARLLASAAASVLTSASGAAGTTCSIIKQTVVVGESSWKDDRGKIVSMWQAFNAARPSP